MALSRAFDIIIAIPSLMLALVVIAATGASIPVLIGTLAIIYTPGAFRTARALAVGVMALDFVAAARAAAASALYRRAGGAAQRHRPPRRRFWSALRVHRPAAQWPVLSGPGCPAAPGGPGRAGSRNIAGLGFGAPAVLFPAVAIASLTIE
jgi:peptide/nickel transport system permease protein